MDCWEQQLCEARLGNICMSYRSNKRARLYRNRYVGYKLDHYQDLSMYLSKLDLRVSYNSDTPQPTKVIHLGQIRNLE